MVRRVHRGVRESVIDLKDAADKFSHNARTYLLSAALQTLGSSMIATVFALYIKSAGMRETIVGNAEGAFGIGMAAIALIGAPLVSSLGYRRLMLAALAMLVSARLAQAVFPTPLALVALALAVGLGEGFLRTVNSAFLAENSTHEERTHLFSSEFLVRMLATFVGALVAGFLPSIIHGEEQAAYQWTITAGVAFIALGMVPIFMVREKYRGLKGFIRIYANTAKGFTAWHHLGRLVAPQAFLVAAGALTAPFVPLYLRHTLGASVAQIGLIQGFGALIVAVAAFTTPIMARKFGVPRSALILQVLALPMLFMVPWIGGMAMGMLAYFSRSALMGIGGPLWNELSMHDVRAKDKPLVAGGLFFALSMAGFVGNVAGGWLMEQSYTAPYLPAAGAWAVGAGLTWLLWVRPAVTATDRAPIALPPSELSAEAA